MARIGKNQLIQLQKVYRTDHAIARLYGMSRQAIHQLRNRYDIPPVSEKHKQRNEQIVSLYREGVSVQKISKRFTLSAMHVYRIIKKT
jgi:predicted DNA-binding protein YlxM (UPF0122 family)